ncbi:UDP-N-acetylglucosamine 4,6-dehydratase [Winogradskyella psychrotolerans RS-3]|uniref:UDP-N-acetylglucosamine 4,6-dehydratase n=1 Tax=Winogradskyella psychrotolerans RS-3 TaxID=641526 RepID=S7VRR0_9FLAO|nr:UDP-N-acetylglucosamine 4,6-dehydratase [Winogradskyella psychrotolerans]EPR72935.1 UDP-N-acetylglucosamine 4,6-dehydratase [Winogradskyella psychrotolerans RS-3]
MQLLDLIGRKNELFAHDVELHTDALKKIVSSSKFLVLGGAGTIGQAVTKEIFKRQPKKLHIVDISENNLVELVRDIRSSFGYIDGDFKTFALDIGSIAYDAFIASDGNYDYVLNLSALKHVRSEEDAFTLMRMIDVNILNTKKTIEQSIAHRVKKYFCVSTDKATNPVNMMGASKRIMELFLMQKSKDLTISMVRFANVAFSDGSLLHSFEQRIKKQQPIVAPSDIKRYFITPKESGELCLMSCIFGENNDILFPQLNKNLNLTSFSDIAIKYITALGYEPYLCDNENEARQLAKTLPRAGKWPYLLTKSDTTGEKDCEEFFTEEDTIDVKHFNAIGIINNEHVMDNVNELDKFSKAIKALKAKQSWTKEDLTQLFYKILPNFNHKETGKFLDHKM